jgi:4-hydroxybenzoate polyprenyltransferase
MSSERALPARRRWPRRLHAALALARVSNSPTIVSNVLAGAALAGAVQPNATIAALAVALVVFYTAGMYLNDVCDYAVDCRERPERPLPSGAISRAEALVAIAALFGIGSAFLWSIGRASFLSGLVLLGLIVVYDMWHKANPLSPLLMAGCRLMVYITAFVAFSAEASASLLIAGAGLVLYLVGLTYIAKSETRTHVAQYWPAALLLLPAAYFAFRIPPVAMLPLLLLFTGWVCYGISLIYRSHERNIGAGIAHLIAGIALYDSLVLAAARSLPGVTLALLAFGLTIVLQRYIRGT